MLDLERRLLGAHCTRTASTCRPGDKVSSGYTLYSRGRVQENRGVAPIRYAIQPDFVAGIGKDLEFG